MVKFKELKNAYKKAVEDNAKTFIIEGHELVVGYAKYLIEYCEMKGAKDHTNIELTPME